MLHNEARARLPIEAIKLHVLPFWALYFMLLESFLPFWFAQ